MVADVVDTADVGMAEAGDRARLSIKALAPLGAGRKIRGKNFKRDRAIETEVDRPINFPHAAHAEEWTDFIRSKRGPGRKSQKEAEVII
jgi:hypothetical protein